MMNGEEMNGGISLNDMERQLVCLLMTSMEAPGAGGIGRVDPGNVCRCSLGFVYGVIMKIYATGVRPGYGAGGTAECVKRTRNRRPG